MGCCIPVRKCTKMLFNHFAAADSSDVGSTWYSTPLDGRTSRTLRVSWRGGPSGLTLKIVRGARRKSCGRSAMAKFSPLTI